MCLCGSGLEFLFYALCLGALALCDVSRLCRVCVVCALCRVSRVLLLPFLVLPCLVFDMTLPLAMTAMVFICIDAYKLQSASW